MKKFRYIFLADAPAGTRKPIRDVMEFNAPKMTKAQVCKRTAHGPELIKLEMRIEEVGAPDPSHFT